MTLLGYVIVWAVLAVASLWAVYFLAGWQARVRYRAWRKRRARKGYIA